MKIIQYAFLSILVMTVLPANADGLAICSGGDREARKVTCLVDGDTGWERGVKWRLKGVDTPEYAAHAECSEEPEQAAQATIRMLELMNDGYKIEWLNQKGSARRDLVRVRLSDGRDAGQVLIDEGFAVP